LLLTAIRPDLAAILAHPDLLVLPTLAADAAVHVRGVGAVLEVIPTHCRQGGFKRCQPGFFDAFSDIFVFFVGIPN
jgi:hypothetical protein